MSNRSSDIKIEMGIAVGYARAIFNELYKLNQKDPKLSNVTADSCELVEQLAYVSGLMGMDLPSYIRK